jgi:hypothetical protein
LEPVLEEVVADEPPDGNREVALVKGHEPLGGRDTDSSPGTFHSMAAVSGGNWPTSTRRRSCSRDTLERVQFDTTQRSLRRAGSTKSGGAADAREHGERDASLLTVDYRIKVHMDLQADKSPVVIKEPFFPRVVNPRYRIRGIMCNARIQSSKARKAIY